VPPLFDPRAVEIDISVDLSISKEANSFEKWSMLEKIPYKKPLSPCG
jgi:hypothetical protein